MTADSDSVYLHDIQDPYNSIPTSLQLLTTDYYYSIISLKSHEGGFAIGGGRKSGDNKGFVDIYHLSEDKIAISITTSGTIEGNGCMIFSIKELKTRTIVFGGSSCEEICLWNYAAWPEQYPECWADQTSNDILDFITIPE